MTQTPQQIADQLSEAGQEVLHCLRNNLPMSGPTEAEARSMCGGPNQLVFMASNCGLMLTTTGLLVSRILRERADG